MVEAVGGAVDAVGPAAGAGRIANRDGHDSSVGSGGLLTVPETSGWAWFGPWGASTTSL